MTASDDGSMNSHPRIPFARSLARRARLSLAPALTLWLCLALGLERVEADNQQASRPVGETGSVKTYRNPLLPEVHVADPHVIRVDGVYYLYATTHTRGYDVYTSLDLVNWTNRGSVFGPRRGAWAPDVFHHRRGDGKFYLYYTDDLPGHLPGGLNKRMGVAVADRPLGPFRDVAVLVTNAIDAHVFQDDDGTLYFFHVDLKGGFKIRGQRMRDPLTPVGEATLLIRPTEPWEMASGHVTEGPWMLKHKGVYYLMYSGSGADSPVYAIGYATAHSPLGPFTKFAGNPIAKREGAVRGPGHHCVVEGPDGKLWMVYHQKWDDGINWKRFLAVDPLWFDAQGIIRVRTTRDTDVPAPGAQGLAPGER